MQSVDLSPLGLFLAASLVGKAVMAVLFAASLWCWVLIVLSLSGSAVFQSSAEMRSFNSLRSRVPS